MDQYQLQSYQLQIDLAEITGETNEYNKLVREKRNWIIDQILKEPKVDYEPEYFDDEEEE
jgi:hypothetical protein